MTRLLTALLFVAGCESSYAVIEVHSEMTNVVELRFHFTSGIARSDVEFRSIDPMLFPERFAIDRTPTPNREIAITVDGYDATHTLVAQSEKTEDTFYDDPEVLVNLVAVSCGDACRKEDADLAPASVDMAGVDEAQITPSDLSGDLDPLAPDLFKPESTVSFGANSDDRIASTFMLQIDSDSPTNNKTSPLMLVDNHLANGVVTDHRSAILLLFKVDSLPQNSEVISATLALTTGDNSEDSGDTLQVCESAIAWGASITWEQYKPFALSPSPIGPQVASLTPSSKITTYLQSPETLRAAVQRWVNMPGSNLGLVLFKDTGLDANFQSWVGLDGKRPRLTVTYK